MRVAYLSSYDRTFRKLPARVQDKVIDAVDRLLIYFRTAEKSLGLGLRQLRKPYWEVRADLSVRILFSVESDLITFILVGGHSDIHRALRRH